MVKGANEKKNYDDIGVFNRVPITGKDFVLDNVVKESKENLIDIQIEMETVFLNGDKDKAKSNILRGIIHYFPLVKL